MGLKIVGIYPKPLDISEHRRMAKRPHIASWADIQRQGAKMEAWLKDTMPFRSHFVAAYIRIWEFKLRSWVHYFVAGKDGDFFPNLRRALVVNSYLGLQPISGEDLVRLKLSYAGTQAFWLLNGAHYLLVLAPDKSSLYPERLPNWTKWRHGQSTYDQLSAALNNSHINFLDMLPVLALHKSEYDMYDKRYDLAHWNGRALDIAYKAIVERLATWDSSFTPATVGEDYDVIMQEIYDPLTGEETVPWLRLKKTDKLTINSSNSSNNSKVHKDDDFWSGLDEVKTGLNNKVMFFTTDSNFKGTHQDYLPGANGNIFPLVYNVGTLIQCHYADVNVPFMKKIAAEQKPNYVVEAFLERTLGDRKRAEDPLISVLGDVLLRTPGYILVPGEMENVSKPLNATFKSSDAGVVLHAADQAQLMLPAVTTDADGRAVVIARIASKVNTVAHLYVAEGEEEFSTMRMLTHKVRKGENLMHMQVFGSPNTSLRLRLDPTTVPGDYVFLPIPELDRLKQLLTSNH